MTKVVPQDSEGGHDRVAEDHGPPVTGLALYGRMLLTGSLKCLLPIIFILMSKPVADGMAGSEKLQEAFEQIAGGLLIYTFAYGCWAEIVEQFEGEAGDVGGGKYYRYCLILLVMVLFSPLFYIVFEVETGQSLFDFGLTGSEEAVCPEHPSALALNLSSPLCHCSNARTGTAGSPTCTETSFGIKDLMPYLIGFALDGMVLVLLEGEEHLFSLQMMRDPDHAVSIFFMVCLKPIMFALDNVLTGTAMATTINGVAASEGVGVWSLYIVCAAFCVVGVIIAMGWHALTALAPREWMIVLRLAFMTLASLSFLDNGLDMVCHAHALACARASVRGRP